MTDINAWLVQSWHQYQALVIVAAGALGLATLLGAVIYAKASHKAIKPAVVFLGSNLALLLNAEGMWDVLTKKADVPGNFAVLVFAVFEICLMISMDQARTQYRRTSVFYTDGERDKDGRARTSADIKKPGDPGAALGVVWFIALLSGTVVATNGGSMTVVLLRLGLPVMVVLMWWVTLTAAGRARRRSRFAYSPRRVMERRGWLTPDDDDLDYKRMSRDRTIRAMITYGHRLETRVWGARWHEWRLTRLARIADEAMAIEVAEQLDRVSGIVNRVVPSRRKGVTGELSGDRGRTATNGHAGHNGHPIAAPALVQIGQHRSVADAVTDGVTGRSVTDRPMTDLVTDAVTDRLTDRPAADERPTPVADGVTDALTEVTGELPAIRSASEDALRDLARDAYRTSVAAGRPMSGAELARKFNVDNPRWGTRRIAEVRAESAPDAQ